jgi:hypothetical protein
MNHGRGQHDEAEDTLSAGLALLPRRRARRGTRHLGTCDRGFSTKAARRSGRPPGLGRALRRDQPRLPARLPGWRLDAVSRLAQRRAGASCPPTGLPRLQPRGCLADRSAAGNGMPEAESVLVNRLLVQTCRRAQPNAAFWSMAVEPQSYLLFPLLLLIVRRWSAIAMLATVTLVVAALASARCGRSITCSGSILRSAPRRHPPSQALALRSRIVLCWSDGRPNTKIA